MLRVLDEAAVDERLALDHVRGGVFHREECLTRPSLQQVLVVESLDEEEPVAALVALGSSSGAKH